MPTPSKGIRWCLPSRPPENNSPNTWPEPTFEHAWDDLVTATRTDPPDLLAVRDAAALLTALLDEAGIEFTRTTRRLPHPTDDIRTNR